MAIQKSNNSGQGSGQGGSGRPRPGHGYATPSGDARPQQSNSEAAAQGTREETGESSGQQGNSSTNNGGNRGPHVRGGWPGPRGGRPNRGRGGYQGRQTGQRARASDHGPLASVTKSSHTQVADVGGAVASRLVNNSLEGGNTHHWFDSRPAEGVWGETRGGGVNELIESAMKRTGATSCQFFLVPNIPGRFDRIAAKAVEKTWEDNSGYNDKGKPAGILRHGVKLDTETKKPIKCVACGKMGHKVATCFSMPTGKDGAQVGCPRCDTLKHHGGDCKEIAALPLPEQVKVLICQRANMTPFKGQKPWWRLLHEYCMSQHFDSNAIAGLPWSKEFTTSMAKAKRIAPMQIRFDTTPGFKLPVDQSLLGPIPLYWKYWEPNDLQWPAVFGQLPARPSGPMDTDGTTATVPAPVPQTGAAPVAAPGPSTGPAPGPQPQVSGEPPMEMPSDILTDVTPVVGQGPVAGTAPVAAQGSVPTNTASDGKKEFEIDYEMN